MSGGGVDITNLVELLRSSFVTWAVGFLFGATIATPGFAWLALPVISSIYSGILRWILNYLSNAAVLEAFFLNTAMTKAGQATDYVNAVQHKLGLPQDVSEVDYAKAEQAEIDAFTLFVRAVV